jgi:hypothetical protein
MWDHLPVESLIGMNAGVGAGRPCAAQSWLRTLDEIRSLTETGEGEGRADTR